MLLAVFGLAGMVPAYPKVRSMSVRILLADDSTTMRKIILRSLGTAGVATIVEAEDGDEAVRMFQPGQFDLVLADWRMPGQTGIEVARQIRRLDAQIPIVLMSTEMEKYPEAEAQEAGVTDRLIKPFSPEAVRDLIDKHCGELATARTRLPAKAPRKSAAAGR